MDILMALIMIIAGFFFLVKGADLFVDSASGIAGKLGISPVVIGLTIVAFGTSMPELAVSVTAALEGANEIALGNVVGSNIFNLFWIPPIFRSKRLLTGFWKSARKKAAENQERGRD